MSTTDRIEDSRPILLERLIIRLVQELYIYSAGFFVFSFDPIIQSLHKINSKPVVPHLSDPDMKIEDRIGSNGRGDEQKGPGVTLLHHM
jgi:hypothetical protein